MNDRVPASTPRRARKPLRRAAAVLVAYAVLALTALLVMPWAVAGPERRLRVIILVGTSIPIVISSWLAWRGRQGSPRWAWRLAVVLAVIAVVTLFVAAWVVAFRPGPALR